MRLACAALRSDVSTIRVPMEGAVDTPRSTGEPGTYGKSIMRQPARIVLGIALACFSSACHGHVHGGGGNGYHGPTVVYEWEPNDSSYTANSIGPLVPGDDFEIRGHASSFSGDLYDGFAFSSTQPLSIEFDLVIHDSASDFDVCLYDPLSQAVVACWQTPFNPEQGNFSVQSAGVPFHLFVEPFDGHAEYSLYVRVYAPAYAASAVPDLSFHVEAPREEATPDLLEEKRSRRARREPYAGEPSGAAGR